MSDHSVRVIVLSGNIGVGKTTLLYTLKAWLSKKRPSWLQKSRQHLQPQCIIVEEDLHDWSFLLKAYYDNPSKYAFDFQLRIIMHFERLYETFLKMQESFKEDGLRRVLVVERSLYDVLHVFLTNNVSNMDDSSHQMLKTLIKKLLLKNMWTRCCHFVLLKCNVEECWRRIILRASFGEREIQYDYLLSLSSSYETLEKSVLPCVNTLHTIHTTSATCLRTLTNLIDDHVRNYSQ